MTRNTSNLKRRSFLKKVVQVCSAIGFVASMVLYWLYVFPKQRGKRKIVYVYACATDDLPDRGVKHFFVDYPLHGRTVTKKIFIVNTHTADLFALSGVCTHLGCLVRWDRRARRFQCPCHQGQYNLSGEVVAGPPPAPLQRMMLKIDNDRVLVGLMV